MVRSYWIGPVVVALAVTGLALSQTSAPRPAEPAAPAETKERTLTVQESGHPGLKCRVLKTWRQPDGHRAYLVQALGTGEFITIAETGDAEGASKGVAMKIYHWGDGQTPPHGTPDVPNNAIILGKAEPRPAAVAQTAPPAAPPAAPPIAPPAAPTKAVRTDPPKAPEPRPSVAQTAPPAAPTKVVRIDQPKAPEPRPAAQLAPPAAPSKVVHTDQPKAPEPAVTSGKKWPPAFASEPADAEPARPAPAAVVKQPDSKPLVLPPSPLAPPSKPSAPPAVSVAPKLAEKKGTVAPAPVVDKAPAV